MAPATINGYAERGKIGEASSLKRDIREVGGFALSNAFIFYIQVLSRS